MSGGAFAPPPAVFHLRSRALSVGVLGLAVAAALGRASPAQFFQSYLLALFYWFGIALGALALLMLHHLTGGAWGVVIRRPLEAAARTLPLMVVMFVPLALGLSHLYPWTDSTAMAADPMLRAKMAYLNVPFFLARAAICLVVWVALAWSLTRWSRRQDETGDPRFASHMRRLSAAGLILWGVTITCAAVDWLMSLEPHWFSTIFGILVMGGQGLGAMAFSIVALRWLAAREPLDGVVRPAHFHDLGNLLLTFVVLWAYFSFSQLLIIWSGNLPEEITWYVHRMRGGWRTLALALGVLHFALPFVLLITRTAKGSIRALSWIAVLVLCMRWVDYLWQMRPPFHEVGPAFHWIDLAVLAGIGGLWVAFFVTLLKQRPLLPVNDPQIAEVLGHA
jgi:hypothetical protein